MRTTIKYFLYLTTIVVFLIAWIAHKLDQPAIRITIITMFGVSFAVALLFNILDRRDEIRNRAERERGEEKLSKEGKSEIKRSKESFALKERK